MLKALAVLALTLMSTLAQAETQSPWFGGEASPPAQIDMEITGSITPTANAPIDCAIYNCARSAKIVTPPQKGAANP